MHVHASEDSLEEKRMTLKNYTTGINYGKTIMEIENILVEHGATNIFKQYENGVPSKIAFQYMIKDNKGDLNPINFLLPMEEEKVLQVLKTSKGVPNNRRNIDQARRTGWRIIKDWIDSQLALVQINLVEFEQVFLPYMYDMQKQETLYTKLKSDNFGLQLEDKR